MAIAGIQQLYFGTDSSKAFVFDNDVFSDDGNNIALRVRTKEFYLSAPNQIDEVRRVYVYADDPQNTNFSVSLDGGDYNYEGQVTAKENPQRFDLWEKCYHISLGLDEISSNNIKIKGFNIHYEPQPETL